jgi:hypothetical protein
MSQRDENDSLSERATQKQNVLGCVVGGQTLRKTKIKLSLLNLSSAIDCSILSNKWGCCEISDLNDFLPSRKNPHGSTDTEESGTHQKPGSERQNKFFTEGAMPNWQFQMATTLNSENLNYYEKLIRMKCNNNKTAAETFLFRTRSY